MDTWNPDEDGITHINVYSRGRTQLGTFLSNFKLAPFSVYEYGEFVSVEGFWYYISTGFQHEILRYLHGAEAKTVGKTFDKVEIDEQEFRELIELAITNKLRAHPDKLNELIDSELPLAHYYVYGGKPVHAGYEWIIEFIEHIRKRCKETNWRAK